VPDTVVWPNFLKADNLLNIANQIAVIAIMAIGMTMVIITGGIDLSVGSLAALSAVTATRLIRDQCGGVEASTAGLVLSCAAAIVVCGLLGGLSGAVITLCRLPPFIVTLAMMLVTSGLAYIASAGQSIYQIPESFVWLGRGTGLFGLPHAVVLMLALYAAAHVLMSRTTLGRYLYAVGGNERAARLTGLNVGRIKLAIYTLAGALAGVAGLIVTARLDSAQPNAGLGYELDSIAAVVIGGTSLSGGRGSVAGTVLGCLIIGVLNNGLFLLNVSPFWQQVIKGGVILLAVALDKMNSKGRET
jgi:ribose transport system permease protein